MATGNSLSITLGYLPSVGILLMAVIFFSRKLLFVIPSSHNMGKDGHFIHIRDRCHSLRENEKNVNVLINALYDRNYLIRRSAAQGLGRLRNPQGIIALISNLHDFFEFETVRAAAASSLAQFLDHPQVIDELLQIITDPSTSLQSRISGYAVEGLSRAFKQKKGSQQQQEKMRALLGQALLVAPRSSNSNPDSPGTPIYYTEERRKFYYTVEQTE